MQQSAAEERRRRPLSLTRALVVASLLVLPGVLLRTVPHAGKFAAGTQTTVATLEKERGNGWTYVPRRLSQRPRLLLALGFAFEVSLHVALIVTLLSTPTLFGLFAALPISARIAIPAFFAALIAGFLGGSGETFPFVSWRMYSGQGAREPEVCLVRGETGTGTMVPVDLDGLVPSVGARRLKLIIAKQADAMLTAEDAEREHQRTRQQATLRAIGKLYNRHHADNPLARIRLAVARVPLETTTPPWLREKRELVSVDVDPTSE